MATESGYNLYGYLLSVTNGNYNKHSISKVFRDLSEEKHLLAFTPDPQVHTLVLVDDCPEPEGEELLLGSSPVLKLPDTLYIEPSTSIVMDEDRVSTATVRDEQGRYYWFSDETGMFLQLPYIYIKSLFLRRTPRIPAREQRLSLVRLYFNVIRDQLQMPGATNTEVYKALGSPTREGLWNEWARLWPDSFQGFQKNDFSFSPLNNLTFKLGTGTQRNKVKVKAIINQ